MEKTSPQFDALKFKSMFPAFRHPDNDGLVYLDNAATTQKPACVIDAIANFYLTCNANAMRSSHMLAQRATQQLEATRASFSDYINAKSSEIVFFRGATEALNFLANTLSSKCTKNDEIIISQIEHHANFLPWRMLCEKNNLQLRVLPIHGGKPDLERLPELVNKKTKIVALTAASNVLGTKVEVQRIRALCAPFKPIIVIDAAQRFLHERIDVSYWDCDFMVCSAHKFFGPLGVGVLYGKYEILDTLTPWQFGGEMVQRIQIDRIEFAPVPHRFEAGTLSLADVVALQPTLNFLKDQDVKLWESHSRRLLTQCHKNLSGFKALSLLTQVENNIGMVSFHLAKSNEKQSLTDLAYWLDSHNVAVRVGQHCAQPFYQDIQVAHGLRISLAPYNTQSDVNYCLELIEHWIKAHCVLAVERVITENNQSMAPVLEPLFITDADIADVLTNASSQAGYKALIQLGEKLIAPSWIRTEANAVTGCSAETWVYHWSVEGKNFFIFDSISQVVSGICCLILYLCQSKTKEEILSDDFSTSVESLALNKQLSASRIDGFHALLSVVREKVRD